MGAVSRTTKSIKNSIVALGFYFINLILQFFSRKVFLDHLGTEVLGLNTTATNLLQILNIAELGIGAATVCTLYKPLIKNDIESINEIISLQGWMYRRIAWIVISGSVIIMCFFPLIFAKMPLPMWYAYASFGVLLISALLSYFFNYKQILLSADQKEYKIQYSYKTSMLLKTLCQLMAIKYFNDGYIWWLIFEALFAIIASVALNVVIRKTYPFLQTDLSKGKLLKQKYPDIITKIKQLFFHKISGLALSQTSTLIIYAYASLTLVAIYGNYMLIIQGITALMSAVFNSMNAGIGNLVAEGNKQRILSVFEELFSIRFLLSTTVCLGVYSLTPYFIKLWIGSKYILDNYALLLLVAILYINLTRLTIDSYIFAYGLFRDVWAPITEAFINIVFSIVFGHFWGLHGILLGVLTSLIIIICCWKPFFLFKYGLKESLKQYIIIYIKHVVAFTITTLLVFKIFNMESLNSINNFISWITYGAKLLGLFGLIQMSLLYISVAGMRNFIHRIRSLIIN